MKRIVSVVIELLLFLLLFYWLWKQIPVIAGKPFSMPLFLIAFVCGTFISKMIETFVDNIVFRNIYYQEYNLLLNRWMVCLIPISMVFYLIFKVLPVFYNEQATESLLIAFGIEYAASHLIISSVLDNVVSIKWAHLITDIKDSLKYEEINDDEFL